MSPPNALALKIAPLPTKDTSNLEDISAAMKSSQPSSLVATPTLQSLLLGQPALPLTKHRSDKPKKRLVKSNSEVATEAMRIARESSQKQFTELRPNGDLPKSLSRSSSGGARLNKFVRRLHDMLQAEKDGGIIEWKKGLLILHSTAAFAKNILPKFFNTRNFKTFRRQLNYYGFVHVRSFSTAAASTTALWVNQELAELGSADIASVLRLKRVEPCELQKTAEGRRMRKEMAMQKVEGDLKINPKTLQLEQIQSMARKESRGLTRHLNPKLLSSIPLEIAFSHAMLPHHASDNVVSDDTQSRSSSSSTSTLERQETDEDSTGAANLLLLLSRADY